ncbi:MAG: 8-oxo-dGTP diphosphatase [Parcubacteria group bacterium]|jgi:8-oxo-dGTP pyrophosphatase MutT (NUDIX family)|nr:8-oxo-dGTP diphosphatase [Candidatus Moranbacteria bacterium]
MNKIVSNLILIYDDKKILLGMKKRGFDEGKWNGFGGKPRENETIKKAAVRELKEEAFIDLKNLEILKERGIINFHFEGNDEIQEVHFLSVSSDDIIGEPQETEEMLPKWFAHSEIPFGKMWVDDPHWMPHLLKGKNLSGEFYFNEDGSAILESKLEVK